MLQRGPLLLILLALSALFLGGCGGGSGVRVTESAQNEPATPVTAIARDEAFLVHIDDSARIATIRNGRDLPKSFLIAETSDGKRTGVLKMRPKTPRSRVRTADILEGQPEISNIVRPASKSTVRELRKVYREPEEGGASD